MDSPRARAVVEAWRGSGGVVPRGPKSLLAVVPAMPADVERHTGRRPRLGPSGVWRLEVGGRFLASGGLVYPGGVPFPEELHSQTAVIAGEVWLYADGDGDVLGSYWWPDAIRRPIAARPRDDFAPDSLVHRTDLERHFSFELRLPAAREWEAVAVVRISEDEALVFCSPAGMPDPLNEMVAFDQGAITLRACAEGAAPDLDGFLLSHQPPYRRLGLVDGRGGAQGIGRDPGRALGPQTWPWPGELRWWESGVSYELKGFQPVSVLVDAAKSLRTPGRSAG